MSRRRPNFPHWQLLEHVFRTCAGGGWRRSAARCLGVERRDLRDRFDRDLTGEEIDALHATLQRCVDEHRHWVNTVKMPRLHAAWGAVQDAHEARLAALALEAQRAEQEKRAAVFEAWMDCNLAPLYAE